MKATDFRLGNYVNCNNKRHNESVIEVESITFDKMNIDFCGYDVADLIPIPLTEEWLLKFGFENSKTQDKFYIINNSCGVSIADDKFRFIQGNFVCQLVLREICFVHELQNLYFALTGEELTLS